MTSPVVDLSTEIAGAGLHPRRFGRRERRLLECSQELDVAVSADWPVAVPTSQTAAIDQLASQVRAMECIVATYDKSTMAGAIGDVALGVTVPDNFVVMGVTAHVITAITDGAGGAPTIQLLLPTDDISALSPTILEAKGIGTCINIIANGAVLPVITTAARAAKVTIADAVVTAGKVRFFIQGYRSI